MQFIDPLTLPEYKGQKIIRVYHGNTAHLKVDFLFTNEFAKWTAGENQVNKFLKKNTFSHIINSISKENHKNIYEMVRLFFKNISPGFKIVAKNMCVYDIFSKKYSQQDYHTFFELFCNYNTVESIAVPFRDFIDYEDLIKECSTIKLIVICHPEEYQFFLMQHNNM